MAVLTWAIHTTSALVGCLSITMLGLMAHCVSLKSQLEYAEPLDLKGTGMSFLFWPACGGIVDCCLFLCLWTKTPFHESMGKRKKRYCNALLFVAAFFFLRPFIVLVYTVVEHDVESWACSLPSRGSNGPAQSLCRELRATRYLLIPLLVLGVIFLTLMVWLRFARLESYINSARGTDAVAEVDDVKAQV